MSGGAVQARDIEAALYLSVVRGVSLARALVDRGVLSERALEEELSRRAGVPLRQVSPAPDLVAKLPPGMCRMLAAVPIRADSSGVVDLAAIDPLDLHVSTEFSFHMGAPVRVQRATMSAIEEAIRHLELAEGAPTTRARRRTPASPHGAPDTVPPSPPPPPSIDEVPIPLVKKVVAAPPLPRVTPREQPAQRPPLRITPPDQAAARLPVREPEEQDARSPAPRRVMFRSAPDVPSVSFPSAPPPAMAGADDVEPMPPSGRMPASLSEIGSEYFAAGAAGAPSEAPATIEEAAPPTAPRPHQPGIDEEPTPIDDDVPPPVAGPEPQAIARSPEAGWSPTLPELFDLIARSTSRDQLLDLVLRAVTLVARRGAIFVVKRGLYQGWACNPAFGAEEDLKVVGIPGDQPSIFATASVTGYYLGPIPMTHGHRALLGVMGTSSSDVAVYVAKIKGKPAVVVIADELDDTLLGTRALGELAKRTGEALARMLAGRQQGS
jgi:hypothetical protein